MLATFPDPSFIPALIACYPSAVCGALVPAHVAAAEATAWLYGEARVAVLAHDTQADPVFVYANRAAQLAFEGTWSDLVGMPSRLSAEAPERSERAAMLAQVAEHGYLQGYRGVRVARSRRRFWIEKGIIWNVRGPDGALWGQAAAFAQTRPA